MAEKGSSYHFETSPEATDVVELRKQLQATGLQPEEQDNYLRILEDQVAQAAIETGLIRKTEE